MYSGDASTASLAGRTRPSDPLLVAKSGGDRGAGRPFQKFSATPLTARTHPPKVVIVTTTQSQPRNGRRDNQTSSGAGRRILRVSAASHSVKVMSRPPWGRT